MNDRRAATVPVSAAPSRLDAALRRSAFALAVVDDAGTVIDATPGFERLVAFGAAAVVGALLIDLVHPDDRAVVDLLLDGRADQGVVRFGPGSGGNRAEVVVDDLRGEPGEAACVLSAAPIVDGPLPVAPRPQLVVGGCPAYAYRLVRAPDGWWFESSERLAELTGRAAIDEGLPLGRLDLVHPDDREPTRAAWDRAERAVLPMRAAYRVLRNDGTVRTVRDEAFPEVDPDGRVATWTGLLVDTTEADDAADAGSPEDRARLLLDSLPVAVYEQDVAADGSEYGSFINRRMEELLGYGGAEWEPTWALWQELIHPDDRDAVLAEERRCDESGEPFRMEYRMRARDGRIVWLRDEAVRTASFADGRQVWHGAMTDITEEVAARHALATSEARFGALVRRSHDLIVVLAADGVVRYASPSALRLLGHDPESLAGADVLAFVHPEDAAAMAAAVAACGVDGCDTESVQARLRHADGSWRAFELAGANLLDEPAVGGIVFNCRDVAERVAAEHLLRESEARFQGFLDRTPVLAMLAGADGRYVWANEQVRRWFGIDPASLVGKLPSDWLPADVAEIVARRNATVVETGEPAESETVVSGVGDVPLELLSIAFPVSGANGERLVGVVAIDVAEQRRAAEAERLLAAMVESADEAIVLRSLDGTILSWNAGAERLYGYTADEAVGSPLSMLVPPEWEDEVREATERVRGGERVGPVETRRRHKDGHLVDVSFTLAPVRDQAGATVAIAAIARDFTEPRRVREALRQANADLEYRVAERTAQLSVVNTRLTHNLTELERTQEALRLRVAAFRQQAQLLDLANDAIVVADPDGTIRFWNPAAERLYGWTEAEAYGAPADRLLSPVYPAPLSAIQAALERDGGWQGEIEHGRKDGSRIVVESRWALQRNERGDGLAVLTINRDVTERARIERERAELAKAARMQARRVEELAQLKDDFTAIVAHELVSPVAAIRWFAEVLAMDGLTTEERDHALATIRSETDLLHVLVDDVRAIAKVDRDDFSVAPREVELAEIVNAAAAFTRSLSGSHPFTVEGRVEGSVLADPARIGQVLRNLLGNAAKYTPPGTPIALRVRDRGERVRIEIADEGPGIDAEDAKRIFDKYRRGRQAGNHQVAGAGIGLYVSRRIVEAHGSDLALQSALGAGATFSLELARAV